MKLSLLLRLPLFWIFIARYALEMVVANARVALDALTPRLMNKPGIIAYPLSAQTDGEITVVANLISLTPGTLSIEVSSDRQILFIHAMGLTAGKVDDFCLQIQESIEAPLLALLRGPEEAARLCEGALRRRADHLGRAVRRTNPPPPVAEVPDSQPEAPPASSNASGKEADHDETSALRAPSLPADLKDQGEKR